MVSNESWMSADELEKLHQPYPDKAYGKCYFEGGGNGTSLKEAFVIERLHQVFGHGNVRIVHTARDLKEVAGCVVGWWLGSMEIWGKGEDGSRVLRHSFDLSGQIEFKDGKDRKFQDGYKGMRTNAISKGVFENLLVGYRLFKGEVSPGRAPKPPPKPKTEEELKQEKAANALLKQSAEIKAFAKKDIEQLRKLVSDFSEDRTNKYSDLNEKEKCSFYVYFKQNKKSE